MPFNPFLGAQGGNSAVPADLRDRQYMARYLLQSADEQKPTTGLGVLAKVLSSGLAGWQIGSVNREAEARTKDYNATLADAVKAGSGQMDTFDKTTGQWSAPTGKPNPDLLAKVLSSNKDTAPMGLQFQMQNMQKAAETQAQLAARQVRTMTPEQYKTITGNDLPKGALAQVDAAGKISISEPRADRSPKTVNTKEGVFILNDDGTLGNRLGSPASDKGDEGNGGPFRGNAVDAQSYNLIFRLGPKIANGSASQQEQAAYALAYSEMTKPRVMPVTDPSDPTRTVLSVVTPQLPPNFPAPRNTPAATLPSSGRPILNNTNGQVSTELSITVTDPRLNNGAPTNIPSIWGGKALDQDGAVQAALSSGQKFQAFPSVDEAVSAARARSAELETETAALPNDGRTPGAPVVGTPGVSITPIAPAGEKPMTGEQSNAALFADRMRASNETLGRFEKQGTNFWQRARSNLPMSSLFTTPEYQQFDQAKRDFINATLRRESGAVIADTEFDNAEKQYFPQPGDSEPVIAQKRRNREIALDGIARAAGPTYQRQMRKSPAPAGVPAPPPGFEVNP